MEELQPPPELAAQLEGHEGNPFAGEKMEKLMETMQQSMKKFDINSTDNPGFDKDFQKTLSNMQADNASFYHPNYDRIKKLQNYYNNQRLFELGVANTYLSMGDIKTAKKWLEKTPIKQYRYRYNQKTLAYDAYISGLYLTKNNDYQEAKIEFINAVNHWYFEPKSTLDIFQPLFPRNTFLLETLADIALNNNDIVTAANYIEIARHANTDNTALYGHLTNTELKELQTIIEGDYRALEKQAEKTAAKMNQKAEFKQALDASRQPKTLIAITNSPLDTLYIKTSSISTWVDDEPLFKFVKKIDTFTNLWSRCGAGAVGRSDFFFFAVQAPAGSHHGPFSGCWRPFDRRDWGYRWHAAGSGACDRRVLAAPRR